MLPSLYRLDGTSTSTYTSTSLTSPPANILVILPLHTLPSLYRLDGTYTSASTSTPRNLASICTSHSTFTSTRCLKFYID